MFLTACPAEAASLVPIESLSEVAAMRGLVSVGIDSLYQKSQPRVVSCLLELTVFIRSRSHAWSHVCWNWQSLSEVATMHGLMSVGIDSLYQKSHPCVVSCLLELTVFIRSRIHAWSRVCWNCCAPFWMPDCLLLQSTVSLPLSSSVGSEYCILCGQV